MPNGSGANISNLLGRAAHRAGRLEQQNQEMGQEASVLDVWTNSYEGMSERMRDFATDPDGSLQRYNRELDAAVQQGLTGEWASSSASGMLDSISAQAGALGNQLSAIGKAEGALATVGATFSFLISIEQMLSTALSIIPFPALPAIRIADFDVGLPHAHNHPPNLTPPNPVPIPLPSTGPVIPIPILSGATRTLINGMSAARCGDMGLGIWCGGYFPMYEVFLGSSNVWIEGARAGRLAVDITKHCMFTSPKPSDPPLGPMVGLTTMASTNVLIGGVPMPSLLSLAMGAAIKSLFKGIGKVLQKLRAARAAKEAGEAAPMFSKGRVVATKPRAQALREVMEEIKAKGIELKTDDEAVAYLDWAARAQGIDPANMHACSLGDDLIIIRPELADNPRIIREELIHIEQSRAGKIASDDATIVANEIDAREQMIRNANEWGIADEEVAEMQQEIGMMRRRGRY